MRKLILNGLYHKHGQVVRTIHVYRDMVYIEHHGGRRDYVPIRYFLDNYSEVY